MCVIRIKNYSAPGRKKKQLVRRNEGIVAVWVFGVLGYLMVD